MKYPDTASNNILYAGGPSPFFFALRAWASQLMGSKRSDKGGLRG
jgi:hypothetical protein